MKNKRLFLVIALFLILAFSFLPFVESQNIVGVSPGNADFKNVLRGGYAERPINVIVDTSSPTRVVLEPRGEVAGWLNFSSRDFNVSRNNPGRVVISVSPPSDVPNGNYTGFLRVRTEALSNSGEEGRATGNILAVIDVTISVEIVDVEVLDCRARNFEIISAEKGDDVIINFDFVNNGNIRLRPRLLVDVWDQEQIRIIKSEDFLGGEVLPTRSEKISFRMSSDDLDIGQYWSDLNAIDCFVSETHTFDVYEPGALRSLGVLNKISSIVWIDSGDTAPVIASFSNVGEKEVLAQFKGQISLDGRIVQVLESERLNVPTGETNDFTFYFTPKNPGRYLVSGRVFYDSKRTFEESTIINVRPKSIFDFISFDYAFVVLIYLLSIMFMLFLLRKIRKERRRYKSLK